MIATRIADAEDELERVEDVAGEVEAVRQLRPLRAVDRGVGRIRGVVAAEEGVANLTCSSRLEGAGVAARVVKRLCVFDGLVSRTAFPPSKAPAVTFSTLVEVKFDVLPSHFSGSAPGHVSKPQLSMTFTEGGVPASGVPVPASGVSVPASGVSVPASGVSPPASGVSPPASGFSMPESARGSPASGVCRGVESPQATSKTRSERRFTRNNFKTSLHFQPRTVRTTHRPSRLRGPRLLCHAPCRERGASASSSILSSRRAASRRKRRPRRRRRRPTGSRRRARGSG